MDRGWHEYPYPGTLFAMIYKECLNTHLNTICTPAPGYSTEATLQGIVKCVMSALLLERRETFDVVDFGLVFGLGDGRLDVVAVFTSIRVEQSVDALEGEQSSLRHEEPDERSGALKENATLATTVRIPQEYTHDKDASEEEVSLGSDSVKSDRHDSHNGESAEPLPHQTDGH